MNRIIHPGIDQHKRMVNGEDFDTEEYIPMPTLQPLVIYYRDNFTCIYCGTRSIPFSGALCLDHITPVRWGGEDMTDNLAVACKRCNQLKGPCCLPYDIYMVFWTMIWKRNETSGIPNEAPVKCSSSAETRRNDVLGRRSVRRREWVPPCMVLSEGQFNEA